MLASMKEPPFLAVDFRATVALSAPEERLIRRALRFASSALSVLCEEGLLALEGRPEVRQFQLSLLVCGDRKIRGLNALHRGKDRITDVLSFPGHESLRHSWVDVDVTGGVAYLGDIAVSYPQSKRQARQHSISLIDEFTHLLVHGILHLLGYDHEISAREEKIMEDWEQRFLDEITRQKKRGPKAP